MKAKLFHIWSEGYATTCEHETAQYICSVYAKTFKEAVNDIEEIENNLSSKDILIKIINIQPLPIQ